MRPSDEAMHRENMRHYGFGPEAMKQVKVCASCGASAGAYQHFCKECGVRLPDRTLFDLYREEHLSCGHCGAVVPDCAHYCPKCGAQIGALCVNRSHKEGSRQ